MQCVAEMLWLSFHSLYSLAITEKDWMIDAQIQEGERGHENPYFIGPLNDWDEQIGKSCI